MIQGTLLAMLALLAALAALAYAQGGRELLSQGLGDGRDLLLRFGPLVIVSFLAAGFAEVLLPQQWVKEHLGEQSGWSGLFIAAGAGIITPSGPFVSMPLAAVMLRSGASVGPVVAFVTGWALLALHRFVAWEIPILGWRFAAFRYGICLAVPVAAGAVARWLVR